MSGRPCSESDLTPGFRELVDRVHATVAAHAGDGARVTLICHGRPGDLLEIDIRPVHPEACAVRVQSSTDTCYNQIRVEDCIFERLGTEEITSYLAAICAGRVSVRTWQWRKPPHEECRQDVAIELDHGGTVRESAGRGWALNAVRTPERRFGPYVQPR